MSSKDLFYRRKRGKKHTSSEAQTNAQRGTFVEKEREIEVFFPCLRLKESRRVTYLWALLFRSSSLLFFPQHIAYLFIYIPLLVLCARRKIKYIYIYTEKRGVLGKEQTFHERESREREIGVSFDFR